MRIALVGLGDIACKAYLPVAARHPQIQPVLCTRNRDVLHDLSARYRIDDVYSDFAELLASGPDAVMIHSSTDSHYTLARAALEADIPVLVDKPLSYHLHEAEVLVDLALERNRPLFCGFNRRYAPLYQSPLAAQPVSVVYQKHRHNQPDDARTFVFDDFIHVLDFVRHAAGQAPAEPVVTSYWQGDTLGSIHVSWEVSGAHFSAAMNRLNGQSRERLEYSGVNVSWQVDNLATGLQMGDGKAAPTGFSDWDDTLYKRGFVTMLEAFLAQVHAGRADAEYLEGVRQTHRLAERCLKRL